MNQSIIKKGFWGISNNVWRDPRTWLFILAITEKSLFRYVLMIMDKFSGIGTIREIVLHSAYIIVIALCLKKGCRFRLGDIFIMLFVVFAIILTWFIYPDNIEKYMFGKEQFWSTVFPLFRYFIVGLFLIPQKETLDLMGKVSCLAILVEFLFVWYILRGSDLQENDDMSRAYFLLLNVLLTINYTFDNKSKIGIIVSVLGIMLLLSMGTRGPVMIVLAFIAAKIIQMSKSKGGKAFFIFAVLFLMWFVNSSYWTLFLFLIQGVLSAIGMSTRVIDLTIKGETLSYYSERDDIFHIVWRKILENPSGYGVYGEWQFVGWSAHNMYLEVLVHYGVILGGVIIAWLFFINIKAFLKTDASPVRSLLLLFACNVLVRGIFGGGFLTSATFLMIGYCLQVNRMTNFRNLLTYAYDKTSNSGGRL